MDEEVKNESTIDKVASGSAKVTDLVGKVADGIVNINDTLEKDAIIPAASCIAKKLGADDEKTEKAAKKASKIFGSVNSAISKVIHAGTDVVKEKVIPAVADGAEQIKNTVSKNENGEDEENQK